VLFLGLCSKGDDGIGAMIISILPLFGGLIDHPTHRLSTNLTMMKTRVGDAGKHGF
jgi:hypothetical protein